MIFLSECSMHMASQYLLGIIYDKIKPNDIYAKSNRNSFVAKINVLTVTCLNLQNISQIMEIDNFNRRCVDKSTEMCKNCKCLLIFWHFNNYNTSKHRSFRLWDEIGSAFRIGHEMFDVNWPRGCVSNRPAIRFPMKAKQ